MKAAVLGSPIAHSLSPALHNAAYRALGLDGWSYTAIECDTAALPALVSGCGPEWAGLSLTMPLKLAVLPLLDETEPLAADTGAANTVIFTADGERRGYNTDVAGMVAALAGIGVTSSPSVQSATVLGAGGTARSALAALRELGLAEVMVLVRDQARAGDLLAAARRLGMAVDLRPLTQGLSAEGPRDGGPRDGGLRDGDLLISTVPAGASDTWAEQAVVPGHLPRAVLDVVYHPWPTVLAQAAMRAGVPVAGGLDLLVHQAARQVELMTGRPAPLDAMLAAVTR
ncbi:MAG TPA: shikimate dehydrogenase [Streptosporangiaceae bacterium]